MSYFQGLVSAFEIVNKSLAGNLGDIANFKLIVPQQATMVKNELTGSWDRVPSENVTYLARVREERNIEQSNIVGDRRSSIELKGYLVEPLNFSDVLPFKIEAELLKSGKWIKGSFYPHLDIENEAIEALDMRSYLGDQLTGYFEIQGSPLN